MFCNVLRKKGNNLNQVYIMEPQTKFGIIGKYDKQSQNELHVYHFGHTCTAINLENAKNPVKG